MPEIFQSLVKKLSAESFPASGPVELSKFWAKMKKNQPI
jgi:hypothetical protein